MSACAALYICMPRGGAGGKVAYNKRAHMRGHDCPVMLEVRKTWFSKADNKWQEVRIRIYSEQSRLADTWRDRGMTLEMTDGRKDIQGR